MQSASSQYFKSKDKKTFLISMILVSTLIHGGLLSFLFLKPVHSRNSRIIFTTVTPVKLVGSVAMAPGTRQGTKSKPDTKPPAKTQEKPPADEPKGPPVMKKPTAPQSKKPTPSIKPKDPAENTKPPAKKTTGQNQSKKPADSDLLPFGAGAGSGNSLGGIIAGSEQFRFNWYVDMVTYRIQRAWSPPFEVGKIGKTLKSVILFEVLFNGNLGQISIEETSGSKLMDDAAINAIREAFPVEPLPRDFPDDVLRLHFYIQHTF